MRASKSLTRTIVCVIAIEIGVACTPIQPPHAASLDGASRSRASASTRDDDDAGAAADSGKH
jgi:hypothetical protein